MFEYDDYAAMILLGDSRALMQFKCPTCDAQTGILTQVPAHILNAIEPELLKGSAAGEPICEEGEAQEGEGTPVSAYAKPSIVCYSSSLR
jgi:hypothetical protein